MKAMRLQWLACALLLCGCASQPIPPEQAIREQATAMRSAISTIVAQPERRATLLKQVDLLEGLLQEHNQEMATLSRHLEKLNADYDAPRESFEKALADFRVRVDARMDRVEAVHFEMVRLMDAKEWKQVVELEQEALRAAGTPDLNLGGKPS